MQAQTTWSAPTILLEEGDSGSAMEEGDSSSGEEEGDSSSGEEDRVGVLHVMSMCAVSECGPLHGK